ncbi:MAG: disulfide bond formation protein B, partial [Proteobacteria bacterium]|nr:disulfide bond formation protein B [Pseudomonadota bacterium]
MISQRLFFFIISGMSVLLILAALALQYLENIAPCPMCILQRFAFIA